MSAIRRCRICGYTTDRATAILDETAQPQDGDFNICLNCGALSVFEGGGVRPPTTVERESLPEEGVRAIVAIKERGRFAESP